MSWALAGSLGLQLLGGLASSKQERSNARLRQAQAEYEASAMENNALLAEYGAIETLAAGREKQEMLAVMGRRLIGSARTSIAASGLRGGDSGLLIRDIYDGVGRDIKKVRHAADRKAELLNWRAEVLRSDARANRAFGQPSGMEGVGPLLSAAGGMANTWLSFKGV